MLGFVPNLIVTTPDKPQGRKLILTPNIVKSWAIKHGIKFYAQAKLDSTFIEQLKNEPTDIFIVASYGKIIPKSLIELPKHKTLNIHPSLLPQYRGASPLQTAILNDTKNTGITIMQIDEQMDHGPIVAQREIFVNEWQVYEEFEKKMAIEGAKLLAEIVPDWVAGKIPEKEQDHAVATYTKKITKEDGLIDMDADPFLNFRKIQAYHEWPQAFFFIRDGEKDIRIKITSASFKSGQCIIEKVIPEGGKEMSYRDFTSGYIK